MSELFQKIIKDRYEKRGFRIERLSGTHHWNVLRIHNPKTGERYIAKGIMHIDDDPEMNTCQRDTAYRMERTVLSKLPEWWGLRLIDSFCRSPFRIIVTNEIENRPLGKSEKIPTSALNSIRRQIEWLEDNKICHGDLELKNILFSPDRKKATIIDFEKSHKITKKRPCNSVIKFP